MLYIFTNSSKSRKKAYYLASVDIVAIVLDLENCNNNNKNLTTHIIANVTAYTTHQL